jgi:RNA polymerase sigma factor (sigma-70 family)
MEASPLTSAGHRGLLARPVPLLRLQSDERLVALIRDGHDRAFEVLFHRYRSRLMAFCRHLVGSPEDAEDVLQDVFASAHRAMLADDRPINARPWLYRIARNRCLNQLRQPVAEGQDSMDIHPHENGASTLEHVQRREEMRAIFADLQELPDTQRTALVLREIDDLSYDEIAEAMGVTLPAVKSLLVRARMSLAEASEARILTCDEVRLELAEAAEGLRKVCGPSRRHVRGCPQCRRYRRELRSTTRALVGALAPFGLLSLLRRLTGAKLGGASAGGAGSAGSAGGTVGSVGGVAGSAGGAAGSAGGVATALGGSGLTLGGAASAAGGAISGIGGALGAQAAIGVATAALITAGAVGVNQLRGHGPGPADRPATAREVTQPIAPAAGTTTHRDAVRYARGGGGHAGGPAAPQSASPAAETPATPAPSALAPTDPAASAPPAPEPAAPAEEAVPPVDTASDDESGNVDEQPAADEGTATADDGEKGKSPADETDDPGDSNTGDGSDQGSGPSAKVCTRPHPPAQCAAPA